MNKKKALRIKKRYKQRHKKCLIIQDKILKDLEVFAFTPLTESQVLETIQEVNRFINSTSNYLNHSPTLLFGFHISPKSTLIKSIH